MAVLAAGVSSLGAGHATARTQCEGTGPVSVLRGSGKLAALCEETLDLRAVASATKMKSRSDNELRTTMNRIARRAGLRGLSQAAAVLSFADMGGAAAGAGVPTLPTSYASRAARASKVRHSATPSGLPGPRLAQVEVGKRDITAPPAPLRRVDHQRASKDTMLLPLPANRGTSVLPLDALTDLGLLDSLLPSGLNPSLLPQSSASAA